MYSRRDFARLTLSGLALSVLPGARSAAALEVRGVKVGLITGTLNPLPMDTSRDTIDVIIEQCRTLGVTDVELVSVFPQGAPQVINGGRFGQPPDARTPEYTQSREVYRQWRINQPLDRFREVRRKFDAAGMNLFSYVQTVDDDMTEPEIDAVYKQMQALGVKMFTTNQTHMAMARRMVPFSEKYGIQASWHPHAESEDPNAIASAESLEKVLAMSKGFVINLDIGHFTAGNQDAVGFLKKHHDRITHLHIKDRKRDKGPNVQLGTGDTPIKECAALIRDNKWPILLILEREYRDAPGTPVEQTKWQLDYVKGLLA